MSDRVLLYAIEKLYADVTSLPVNEPKVFKAWNMGFRVEYGDGFVVPHRTHLITKGLKGHKRRVAVFEEYILPLYDQLYKAVQGKDILQESPEDITPACVSYSNHFFRSRIKVRTVDDTVSLDIWAPKFSTFTGRRWCFNGNRIRAVMKKR